MTAKLDDMPNPFCFAASPSPLGAPHNSGEREPSVTMASGEGEDFLPGLQIGDAGQQLDEVRFLHEIMPARRGVNLDDGLAAHVPLFLAMKAPD